MSEGAGLGLEIQSRLGDDADSYNEWIASRFRPFAGERLLDAGSALGNVTRFFLDRELVIGLDVTEEFTREISARFADHQNFRTVVHDLGDPFPPELRAEEIDTVLCVNVLEHVEDHEGALRNMHELLVPGGRLLLLVPALPSLFGTLDEADHHFRRYTRASLAAAVSGAGFAIERIAYTNPVGMLGWFVNGKILRRRLVPRGHYRLYNRLVPVLGAIERVLPPPLGLSLICIARKP